MENILLAYIDCIYEYFDQRKVRKYALMRILVHI